MKRILIVEDDQDIAVLEKDYLEASGYTADIVSDGAIVVSTILRGEYDLILLDLMLPNYSGYDICREIRGKIDVPILMVTARTESADKIKGLGLGADDYIAKPFDPAELVARVKSHLKRYQRLTNKQKPQPKDDDDTIYVSDLKILPRSWKVFRNHKEIRFPNREFELLLFWLLIPMLFFPKRNCLKKSGDMITPETALR